MGGCLGTSTREVGKATTTTLNEVTFQPLESLSPIWKAEEGVKKCALEQQVRVFWTRCTRYGGKESVWKLLQQICELESSEVNLQKARQMLSNKSIKLPNGSLSQAIDDRGYQYSIPMYCCSYPINVIIDDETTQDNLSAVTSTVCCVDDSIAQTFKGPPPPLCEDGKKLVINLRLSSDEQSTRSWTITTKTTISYLKAKVHHCDGYMPVQQRFFYAGKELRDHQTMENCKVGDGHMIQVILKIM